MSLPSPDVGIPRTTGASKGVWILQIDPIGQTGFLLETRSTK